MQVTLEHMNLKGVCIISSSSPDIWFGHLDLRTFKGEKWDCKFCKSKLEKKNCILQIWWPWRFYTGEILKILVLSNIVYLTISGFHKRSKPFTQRLESNLTRVLSILSPVTLWVHHPLLKEVDRLGHTVFMAKLAGPLQHLYSFALVKVRISWRVLEPNRLVQRLKQATQEILRVMD